MALIMGPKTSTAIKICGITQLEQAMAIAKLGINALGVIGVHNSPRFVSPSTRREIFSALEISAPDIKRVWVIANLKEEEILEGLKGEGTPSVLQLHGQETEHSCKKLQGCFPNIEIWKAFRIREKKDLLLLENYKEVVDAFLIDAWDPKHLGGTGKQLPIEWLKNICLAKRWWLAGGICADCIPALLSESSPYGIDASSRLEVSPGVKDLLLVKALVKAVASNQV